MTNQFLARMNTQRLALRIARRGMKRNLLQSILIVLIIAAPVMVGTGALVYIESKTPTPQEKADYTLGHTQAKFTAQLAVGPEELAHSNNIYQMPDDPMLMRWSTGPMTVYTDGTLRDPRTLGISGTWLTEHSSTDFVKTATGIGNVVIVEGTPWASQFEGRYKILSGRAPQSNDEVMVTQAALERMGIKVGDNMSFASSSARNANQTRKVVGVLQSATLGSDVSAIFANTASISGVTPEQDLYGTSFYLVSNQPITWQHIMDVNRYGIGVTSRDTIFNPPTDAEIPLLKLGYVRSYLNGALAAVLYISILLPAVLLPIAVLAGSAFSFGARRQARTLAILSSLGAKRRNLRAITIVNGLWLGFLGGVVGVAAGIAVAFFAIPAVSNGSRTSYPGFHVPPLPIVGIIVAGALIGALVSLIPAFSAAKVDVLNTLRGIRAVGKVKRRAGIGSLIVIALGTSVVLTGVNLMLGYRSDLEKRITTYSESKMMLLQYLPIIGSVVLIIGLLLGTGWLLMFARAVIRRSSVSANYATNDLIYNRKRYQPVVAASIATSFVAASLLGVFYSVTKVNAESYRASYPQNQIAVDPLWSITEYSTDMSGQGTSTKTRADYEQTLATAAHSVTSDLQISAEVAPVATSAIIARHIQLARLGYKVDRTTGMPALGAEGNQPIVRSNPDYLCPWDSASPMNAEYVRMVNSNDQLGAVKLQSMKKYDNCGVLNSIQAAEFLVGDASDLSAFLGKDAPADAVQMLNSGGAVVFHQGFRNNGKTQLDWYPSGASNYFSMYSSGDPNVAKFKKPNLVKTDELNSVFLPVVQRDFTMMISKATADKLGIDYKSSVLFVNYKSSLSVAQRDTLNAEIIGGYGFDSGYGVDPDLAAWIIVAVAGFFVTAAAVIALGLAQIESRADQSTLGAIGAPRRFRARVLGLQALTLTILGTVFGTATGIYLSWSLMSTGGGESQFRFALWQNLTLGVGIAILTGIIMWATTSRRQAYRVRLSID